jgi:hypothetical protein
LGAMPRETFAVGGRRLAARNPHSQPLHPSRLKRQGEGASGAQVRPPAATTPVPCNTPSGRSVAPGSVPRRHVASDAYHPIAKQYRVRSKCGAGKRSASARCIRRLPPDFEAIPRPVEVWRREECRVGTLHPTPTTRFRSNTASGPGRNGRGGRGTMHRNAGHWAVGGG